MTVPRVTRHVDLPGPISAAEALWYDLGRRPSFVEGFGHLVRTDPAWPQAGSRVVWDGPPGGRGRVSETVDAYSAREGQSVHLEDERLRGTQVTTFVPLPGTAVRVTVRLEWALKDANPAKDWLLVRRALGESLRRTLARYRIERLSDLDDERAAPAAAP